MTMMRRLLTPFSRPIDFHLGKLEVHWLLGLLEKKTGGPVKEREKDVEGRSNISINRQEPAMASISRLIGSITRDRRPIKRSSN